ncbi:Uncharacterised protein [Mycobacteroides abscessus subsp. abscessus]|nr:Uncharacterised protein [Mycobacteroides abscessus subsp. abscessus]
MRRTSANFGSRIARCFCMCARTPSASPKNRRWRSWLILSGPMLFFAA